MVLFPLWGGACRMSENEKRIKNKILLPVQGCLTGKDAAGLEERVKENRRKDKLQTHIFHPLCLRLK